ncbi:MAG: TraR/DksA family transcriptional regulator [Alphaproteobacteria bacterium]
MGRKRSLDPMRTRRRTDSVGTSMPADAAVAGPAPAISAMVEGRLPRMDAMQTQAAALEAECRRQIIIHRIDAALARIDSGEYGYCLACSGPIEPDRLEREPTVATCLGCAGAGR